MLDLIFTKAKTKIIFKKMVNQFIKSMYCIVDNNKPFDMHVAISKTGNSQLFMHIISILRD